MSYQLSDSIVITQTGNESHGVIVVKVDSQFEFYYEYSPENPPQSHEQLALLSVAQC